MMETFIVLGLCFILYEALDLFQSCYNKERHQHQSSDGACDNDSRPSGSGRSSSSRRRGGRSIKRAIDTIAGHRSNVTESFCVNTNNNSHGGNSTNSNATNDTAHLMPLDVIDELDLDSDDSYIGSGSNPLNLHLNKSGGVYSICDRVNNNQNIVDVHFNNHNNNNTLVCVDDNDKLIAQWIWTSRRSGFCTKINAKCAIVSR